MKNGIAFVVSCIVLGGVGYLLVFRRMSLRASVGVAKVYPDSNEESRAALQKHVEQLLQENRELTRQLTIEINKNTINEMQTVPIAKAANAGIFSKTVVQERVYFKKTEDYIKYLELFKEGGERVMYNDMDNKFKQEPVDVGWAYRQESKLKKLINSHEN